MTNPVCSRCDDPEGIHLSQSDKPLCWPCAKWECQCGKFGAEPRYDRHGIYSGKACEACTEELPGQGSMWDYDAEEPIEPEIDPIPWGAGDSWGRKS